MCSDCCQSSTPARAEPPHRRSPSTGPADQGAPDSQKQVYYKHVRYISSCGDQHRRIRLGCSQSQGKILAAPGMKSVGGLSPCSVGSRPVQALLPAHLCAPGGPRSVRPWPPPEGSCSLDGGPSDSQRTGDNCQAAWEELGTHIWALGCATRGCQSPGSPQLRGGGRTETEPLGATWTQHLL